MTIPVHYAVTGGNLGSRALWHVTQHSEEIKISKLNLIKVLHFVQLFHIYSILLAGCLWAHPRVLGANNLYTGNSFQCCQYFSSYSQGKKNSILFYSIYERVLIICWIKINTPKDRYINQTFVESWLSAVTQDKSYRNVQLLIHDAGHAG